MIGGRQPLLWPERKLVTQGPWLHWPLQSLWLLHWLEPVASDTSLFPSEGFDSMLLASREAGVGRGAIRTAYTHSSREAGIFSRRYERITMRGFRFDPAQLGGPGLPGAAGGAMQS